MNDQEDLILTLNARDAVGLYISLKKQEADLNESGELVLKEIEHYLYSFLTIEQFTDMEQLYSGLR